MGLLTTWIPQGQHVKTMLSHESWQLLWPELHSMWGCGHTSCISEKYGNTISAFTLFYIVQSLSALFPMHNSVAGLKKMEKILSNGYETTRFVFTCSLVHLWQLPAASTMAWSAVHVFFAWREATYSTQDSALNCLKPTPHKIHGCIWQGCI